MSAPGEPLHPLPPTPGEPLPPRPRSNLALRLLTAALLIPPITWLILSGGIPFLAAVLVILWLAIEEFYRLIESKGAEPLRAFGIPAALALPVVVYLGGDYAATVLMSVTLLVLMIAQLGKSQIKESLASISGTFFGVFYVGWLLSHAVALRKFHDVVEGRWGASAAAGLHEDVGGFLLFFTACVVIAGDAGAYFVGRAFGKRKLAPSISPNKTVEGALGALAAGLVFGLLCKGVFLAFAPELTTPLSWLGVVLLSPLLAGVGILGDLIESLLKRDARVKDTGTLLPGTGGVLDRIDSNLIGIPVMYYLLLAYTYLSGSVPVAPGLPG